MKLILLITLFLYSTFLCSAQTVAFQPSLQIAFKKAAIESKPVFVEYYNAECPVCKKLEPVFEDKDLAAFYNEHFISYKLNTENIKKEDSLFLIDEGLSFESVPYFLFFDKDRHFIHYSGTKQDIAYLIAAGQTALDPGSRAAGLGDKYKAGDRSIKTLYAYSNLLQLYKKDSLRSVIADQLYEVYPKETLGTEKSYIITKNCVNSIENGFFLYWIGHIDLIKELEKNTKSAHETNVLGDILQRSINGKEKEGWGLDKISTVKTWVLKSGRYNDAMTIFGQRIANDSGQISPSVYTIDHYLELFTDKANLGKLKAYIDRLSRKKATIQEKADLLYCTLLYYKKVADKKMAARISREAIDFYTANKIDTVKLSQLLAE
jgi:thiol-disulfide isomerase/thioredoxin